MTILTPGFFTLTLLVLISHVSVDFMAAVLKAKGECNKTFFQEFHKFLCIECITYCNIALCNAVHCRGRVIKNVTNMNAAANARWYGAIHKMTKFFWKRAFKVVIS